jgi:hypothetical protein
VGVSLVVPGPDDIGERKMEGGVGVSWSGRQGEETDKNIHRERSTYTVTSSLPSQ